LGGITGFKEGHKCLKDDERTLHLTTPLASFTQLTIRKLGVEMMTKKLNAEVEIVRKIVTEDFKRMEVSTEMEPAILSDEPVSNSYLSVIIF
jgi:hypothetical protein